MRIKQKLIASLVLFVLLAVALGLFGLIASRQIARSFEGGEQHFRSIVSAATDASSYIKRSEAHLLLYLNLHNVSDRDKFARNYSSLMEQITMLEQTVNIPEAVKMVVRIRSDAEEFLTVGNSLISVHDDDVKKAGSFNADYYGDLIRKLNDLAASIRENGVQLSIFETNFLNRQEAITAAAEVSSYIKRAEGHVLVYLLIQDKEDRGKYPNRYSSVQENIEILDSRLKDPEARVVLDRIRENTAFFHHLGNTLLEAYDEDIKTREGFVREKYTDLIEKFHNAADVVRGDALKLSKLNVDFESQKKEAALKKADLLQNYILVFIVAFIFMALTIGYFLYGAIANPIIKLQKAADSIGKGKLDTPIDIQSEDEIGDLAVSFREMAGNLQKTMVSSDYVGNILRSMMDSLVVIDLQYRIRTVNEALCSMLGYTSEELTGQPIHMIFADEYSFNTEFEAILRHGYLRNIEKAYRSKDGREIPVLFSGSAIRDSDGATGGIACVALDITERKDVEEKLIVSERNYRNFVDNAIVGVYKTDLKGNILYANDALISMFEFSSLEDIQQCGALPLYINPEDRDKLIGSLIKNGRVANYEIHMLTKSGKHKNILLNGALYGDVIAGMMMDITDKVTLQEEALRAGQLASLGELAAGVAHEINNPINGVINYAQILSKKFDPESFEHDITGRIIKEGDRIATIVSSLLSFARDMGEDKRHVHISEILQEALNLTKSQLEKDGIVCRVDMPDDVPDIFAHPHQIEQVILNVISNARYALNQKYQGHDEQKVLDIRCKQLFINALPYMRIIFYDHGSGIPASILDKVMNPFVSTKPKGLGTGLGLSISHGIIKDHGGSLRVDSVEGEFTRVVIDLPASMYN